MQNVEKFSIFIIQLCAIHLRYRHAFHCHWTIQPVEVEERRSIVYHSNGSQLPHWYATKLNLIVYVSVCAKTLIGSVLISFPQHQIVQSGFISALSRYWIESARMLWSFQPTAIASPHQIAIHNTIKSTLLHPERKKTSISKLIRRRQWRYTRLDCAHSEVERVKYFIIPSNMTIVFTRCLRQSKT